MSTEISQKELARWYKKLDEAGYRDLLELRRYAPIGHAVFRNDLPLYEYFHGRFEVEGAKLSQSEKVAISKRVGW